MLGSRQTRQVLWLSILTGFWLNPASAQNLCDNPAGACGATLESACVERLGAGALPANEAACASQLTAYRNCLVEVARSCGDAVLTSTPQESAARLDLARLFRASQLSLRLQGLEEITGSDPKKVNNSRRCREDPDCARSNFLKYHGGQIVFDVVSRDADAGELIGWLPQSQIKEGRRARSTDYTGRATISETAVILSGEIFTDGFRSQCSARLLGESRRTLRGLIACRGMSEIEVSARF